ncbi:hypothetical protein PS838_01475 [Pseudomonas fluorescens]|nr:hypothetical protein PS838_01475 [Pseudomonas fluorescens]
MKHRFHFFPEPFEDETLHSVLSRYARLHGHGTNGPVFAATLWDGSFSDNVPFPCDLRQLVEALPKAACLTVPLIVERHTLLPYYQPFLSVRQVQAARSQMAFSGSEGLGLRLGLTASRLQSASKVLFCPACVKQDAANVGVAYWHRIHQLPGVLICPRHLEGLVVFDHSGLDRFRKILLLPEDEIVQSRALALDIDPNHRQGLVEISQSSQELLQANASPQSMSRIREVLVNGAVALGLASSTGRLRLAELASHIDAYFNRLAPDGEFLILAGGPSTPEAWVTKLLRKPRCTHHPLKFILLASGLKVRMVELISDVGTVRTTTAAELPSATILRTLEIPQNQRQRRPAYCKERPEGMKESIWTLAEYGMEATEIADQMAVSLPSVYRIIRESHGGSEHWNQCKHAKVLTQRRRRFKNQYRSCCAHECTDYMWLYRHDRAWLTERCDLPYRHPYLRGGNRSFENLDPHLALEILNCARGLRATLGKPVRISRTRIGRELNSTARFEKQLGKLPMCAAALACVCESRDEFHKRRLLWAEQQLLLEGKFLTPSLIYRTACIRPSN